MRYLKTFESYTTSSAFDATNEEFLDALKMRVKEGWEKIKSAFMDSKFVKWSKENLAKIISNDAEASRAAKELGIDLNSPDLFSEIVQKGKELKNTPEGEKLAASANATIEEVVGDEETAVAEGKLNEGFWSKLLQTTLKVFGYGGMIANFSLLVYAWMKAALGFGFFTTLLGATLSVGAVTAIVCLGIVVFGVTIAISREFKGADGRTDAEAGRF